jgi:hypothetical protein
MPAISKLGYLNVGYLNASTYIVHLSQYANCAHAALTICGKIELIIAALEKQCIIAAFEKQWKQCPTCPISFAAFEKQWKQCPTCSISFAAFEKQWKQCPRSRISFMVGKTAIKLKKGGNLFDVTTWEKDTKPAGIANRWSNKYSVFKIFR